MSPPQPSLNVPPSQVGAAALEDVVVVLGVVEGVVEGVVDGVVLEVVGVTCHM